MANTARNRDPAPEPRGVFEGLCREIDYLRDRDKKRKKKLWPYLKQFQQATRALSDGTVVLDGHGSVKWANKAATACLGILWPDNNNQRITNLIRMPELVEFINVATKNSSIDIA
jgi:two-component system phosphate regulon sensor histidine kinase PhoR